MASGRGGGTAAGDANAGVEREPRDVVAWRRQRGQVSPGARLRVVDLGRPHVCGRGVATDDKQTVRRRDQGMAAARVPQGRELGPRTSVQPKKSSAVAAEGVSSGNINLVVE